MVGNHERCALCDPGLGPILLEGEAWRVVLNRNQNLLGKCFIVTRRHVEPVTDLTPEEWQELHGLIGRVTAALADAFQPDHFNYAFLQNQDPHVHLHIVPRYAADRTFGDRLFVDPDYPGHYAVPSPVVTLSAEEAGHLADLLRARLAE